MRTFLLFLLTAAMAAAQIVSVGVKAGIPLTQATSGDFAAPNSMLDTGRWTIGPTIEFRLPFGFSAEADASYRGYRAQASFLDFVPAGAGLVPAFYVASQSSTKVWDFPVLLKYHIGSRRFRPFAGGGYTFSRSTANVTNFGTCLTTAAVCQASYPVFLEDTTNFGYTQHTGGPTGSVGVEYKYWKLRFTPEVRYTHVMSAPKANLVTIMLGVTF
jgi:hypothetical protein